MGLFFHYSDVVSNLDDKNIDHIYQDIQSVSLALFGILLTVLALLASLVNHNFIEKMKKIGQFHNLMKSIFINTFCFLCLILFTFIKNFLNVEQAVFLIKFGITLFIISIFLLIDIGKKFWFVFCGLSQSHKI